MTTLRTAAQQALNALEQSETTVRYEGFGLAHREAERKHQAAITALRAALAQEQAEPTSKERLQVESAATTQQPVIEKPPSDYRRGYWDGFAIGKREGRIEAEDAAKQAEPKGGDNLSPPWRAEPDLSRCPQCNGPADNGHDCSIPPNPYLCTKCMAEPVAGIIKSEIRGDNHQTLDDAMRLPRAMAQAYERGYKAGVAARDAEHQQTLALQQRSYEREIQLDVEAERERCLRLIDEHVRAVDAEDLVRAIKEGM